MVALAAFVWTSAVAAQTPVDVALVLAVDASGSIDEAEFKLQKDGIALAVTDAVIVSAVQAGARRKIAIAYVEWGSPGAPRVVVDWTIIADKASAESFAATLLAAPRSAQSYNAIGDAIALATHMIETCPCKPMRSVVDISGDNRDLRSLIPAPLAREVAIKAGITINALAILQDDRRGSSGKPLLVENYEQEIAGGLGAFVHVAQDRRDFARAIRRKMALEISMRDEEWPIEGRIRLAGVGH
jgi:hypothetical protein